MIIWSSVFFLLFSHCILYQQFPTSICCCCSPFSSHSFQISLNTSSHHILNLPRLLFLSTFWASAVFANFSSPILSTCGAHFSLLLTSYLLNVSFTQLLLPLSVCPFFSSKILCIQLFWQTYTVSCCISVSAIVSRPHMLKLMFNTPDHTCIS